MVQAQTGSTVKVHYTGRLADGEVFDSSLDPPGDSSGVGEPLGFVIGSGQMIPAFEQGVICDLSQDAKWPTHADDLLRALQV